MDSSSLAQPSEEYPVEEHRRSGVCFLCVSGSVKREALSEPVLEERPLNYQSLEISSELWQGEIVKIDEQTFTLDIRDSKQSFNRRVIRVKKDLEIIIGDKGAAFRGMRVDVLYRKMYENSSDREAKRIKEEVIIRLRQPSQIPLEARLKEKEEKMKRYSYMFEDGK